MTTHRYSHTYTRMYISTYHILWDKVWFRVVGCTEVALKSMKEFWLQHWGKWSRNIWKDTKAVCSCLLAVSGTLGWAVRKDLVFRRLSGMSFIICISEKFEHLEIWHHVKSGIWGHFLYCYNNFSNEAAG